jgi:kynurenine formamidase
MKIVDLTKPIQYNKQDPWFMRVKIKHKKHRKSLWIIKYIGKLPKKLLPKHFEGWADDQIVKMGVHATTHIDAPWHYGPTTNGKPAKTVDQIPLESCIGQGIKIDMSHKADFDPITKADIQLYFEENTLQLKEGMIVLIQTGRAKFNGTKNFHKVGTGMSAEATEFLIDQGITVMGIDQWGWDIPLLNQIEKVKKDNNPELFWEGHRVGQRKEYWHMEQLVNLESLPNSGFKVMVLPLKIIGASAAPARVIALFD